MLDQQKTAQAIASVQGVAQYLHDAANVVAGALGLKVGDLQTPTNLPQALGNLEGSINALVHVCDTFTATAAVVPVLLEKAQPVILKVEQKPAPEEEMPDRDESEALSAGGGGINHANRIGIDALAIPTTNGVHVEEPAQKGRKRKGGS